MTGSNDTSDTDTSPSAPPAAVTPLTPAPQGTGPRPLAAPEGVEFQERVRPTRGRSTTTRVGVITGSALLVLVGVAAAMGASASPATESASSVGADPTAVAPAATPDRNAGRPWRAGPMGVMPGMGFHDGTAGIGIGFHDITITAIDKPTISLATDDGWKRTITVTDATTITKGGAAIAFTDLAVGDKIQFRQERATDGTYTVTAIAVVLPTIAGQISAIDGTTITVTQPGGTTATIHVDANTTYSLAGRAGSLSDLKVGSVVVAAGTQRSDGSLDAASIRGGFDPNRFRGPGFPDGLGGGHDQDQDASPAPSTSAS
jgi:hypothetical protein